MEYRLQKSSGTYADALQALGTASLLSELTGEPARVRDTGPTFVVTCNGGVAVEDWHPPSPGFLFIWRSEKDGPRPVGRTMDYEREKKLADALKKSRATKRARKAAAQGVQEESEAALPELDSEYRLAAIIESMRKGWAADKDLFRWIVERPGDALAWARDKLARPEAESPLALTNSQLLNPSMGKGTHATKTVATSPGSIAKALVDPFAEWMKLRGLYRGLLAYRVDDDFKFFVIEPGDIAEEHVAMLRGKLRDLELWGGVRLDIQVTLRLTAILVEHSDAHQGEIDFFDDAPNRVIPGLRQAFFKSLGTAAALMNDALLPLPDWFPVRTEDDVQAYLKIVDEPYGTDGRSGPLTTLREDRSDDVPILQAFRRWLASGLLDDLLEMHSQFAVHVMQRLGSNDFARPFSVEVLDLLLQRLGRYPRVKDIVTRDGFRNIARAVRNTTIYAASLESSKREVRFGLAQKWKQRIKAGDEAFLATLAEFVQEQNWEVVHRLKGEGYVVTESDLNDFVDLIQTHGAELVGMLLLAYGFARAESTQPKSPEQQTA